MQGVGTGTIEANQLLGDSNLLETFLILLSRLDFDFRLPDLEGVCVWRGGGGGETST